MIALESELAAVSLGGKEYVDDSKSPTIIQEYDKPGRRRSKGKETKQARSYQRITNILRDESYFGPTEPVSSVEIMSAAKAKALYQEPGRDVLEDAKMAALYDEQHVPDMIPEGQNEIVLRISFYTKRFAKDQEFLVLGSQPLSVLRDAINCAVDGMMAAYEKQKKQREQETEADKSRKKHNHHNHRHRHPSGSADSDSSESDKEKNDGEAESERPISQEMEMLESGSKPAFFKSASFLIENVFYNDMRDPHNADYSAPILDWVEERRKELHMKCSDEDALVSAQHGVLGPYRVEDMPNVRFDQLFIRIGSIYSFLHQADCEHRFMISDVRLLGPGEDHDRSNYPLLMNRSRITRSRCDICGALVASKVTCNDSQAPCSPCHWCQHCYDSFHLRSDGSLAYTDFQTLPYIYDTK